MSMKTMAISFLLFLTTLYSMDVAPYKYPSSFIIESQRKVEVPIHTLGFQESKEEPLDLDKCLEMTRKVPLKQLVYEGWLKGHFLLLARVVTMAFGGSPIVSWYDMRELVEVIPRSPRNRNGANIHRFSIPDKCGEILYYFVPHDKYTHVLGALCSETNLNECINGGFCSSAAELTRFLAMYHIIEYNQLKVELLEAILRLSGHIKQTGESHIPFIQKHYQSLLLIEQLLCKKKRSRKDHKTVAGQELNKKAQVESQLQLGYRYIKRKNIKEAVAWLSKAAEQDFFPQKREDAREVLSYIQSGVPLTFIKKGHAVSDSNSIYSCPEASGSGKEEAEEYSQRSAD